MRSFLIQHYLHDEDDHTTGHCLTNIYTSHANLYATISTYTICTVVLDIMIYYADCAIRRVASESIEANLDVGDATDVPPSAAGNWSLDFTQAREFQRAARGLLGRSTWT